MQFFSRAKLLLTGEYLVLHGAKALAAPLKFGQTLKIETGNSNNLLHWCATENESIWFEAQINISDLTIIETTDEPTASYLIKVLKAAKKLNPSFLEQETSIRILTGLNFERCWGLGTSSTLISNIAYWARIDPFHLHRKVSEGSGYDIACAREDSPLIYFLSGNIPVVKKVRLDFPFADKIYFAYLGNKQNSAQSIMNFGRTHGKYEHECRQISEISENFITIGSLEEAKKLIRDHEKIIGSLIKKAPIKGLYFNDFNGEIKSLGAWGGDFAMALSEEPQSYIKDYFNSHHLHTIYTFNDLIYQTL